MPSPGTQEHDAASTASHDHFTDSGSHVTGPLQTLNSSLKRIRLDEMGGEPMTSRSDSLEKEWGALDLTELDESELSMEAASPSTKKARTVSKACEQEEDMDDISDFMPSEGQLTIVTTAQDEQSVHVDRSLALKESISSPTLPMSSRPAFAQKIQSSSANKLKSAKKPVRSHNGMEDVFSHEQVRSWSEVRIKTWEHRRTNTEGFYYRFVDPTEGQQNGPWSPKSIREFTARLDEWKERGIRIGTSWGIFSMRVSHKAGYQCSSYYRKLLETKKLTDPAYAWEGGKLVMVNKSSGGEMALSGLSERWDTAEVKEIEANVNSWIKEYHGKSGLRPTTSKPKRADTVASTSGLSSTTSSRLTSTSFRPATEAPRVKATTAPAVPKALSLRPGSKQQLPDESELLPTIDINDKLAEYSSFMKKSTSTVDEPGRIRQAISFTVAGTVASGTSAPARGIVSIEARKMPLATNLAKGQTGLSLFWKNIRPVRVECPDIPKYIIPKDVEQRPTWAHRIQSVTELDMASVEGTIYMEVPKMIDFDWATLSEGFEESVTDFQGVLADPPWNFIVEDGRNDGACRLTTTDFGKIMEKALDFMPSGIVSVWTHKAILPEVGEGFDIRHQRTADVIMDFEKPTSCWIEDDYTEPKPDSAYEMMEIMLPDARYLPESGRGRLLEIWGKKSQGRRSGWFSIHELKRVPSDMNADIEGEDRPPAVVEAMLDGSEDMGLDGIDEALFAEIANDMDMDSPLS
ncbi:hypothetical protein EDD11_010070 [Mortierella claussenii]|nr:hypothetical protein EDD11_010070 [Mortierella claussenii]